MEGIGMNDHDLRALATALLKRYGAEEEGVSKIFDTIKIDRGVFVPLPEITEEERALLNMLGGRKANELEGKRGSLASRGCNCNCNCNCGSCSGDDDDDDDDDSSESADAASAAADAASADAADAAAAAADAAAAAAESQSAEDAAAAGSLAADAAAAADAADAAAAAAAAAQTAGDPSISAEAATTAEENATTSEKGEVADSFGSLLGSISDNPDAPSAGATPASGSLAGLGLSGLSVGDLSTMSPEMQAALAEALSNAPEEGDLVSDNPDIGDPYSLSQQTLDSIAAQNADLDAALSDINAGLNATALDSNYGGMLSGVSVADQPADFTAAVPDAASLSPDASLAGSFTTGTVGPNTTGSIAGDVATDLEGIFADTRADSISPNVDDAVADESSKEGLQLGEIGTTKGDIGMTIAGLDKGLQYDVLNGNLSLQQALDLAQQPSLTISGSKSVAGEKGDTVMGPVFGGPVNDVTTVDLVTEDQAAKDAAKSADANAANTAATTAAANTAATTAANAPAASKNGVTAPANSGMAATLDAARDAASKGLLQNFLDTYGKTAVVAGETNYAGNVAALGPAVMAELQAANKAALSKFGSLTTAADKSTVTAGNANTGSVTNGAVNSEADKSGTVTAGTVNNGAVNNGVVNNGAVPNTAAVTDGKSATVTDGKSATVTDGKSATVTDGKTATGNTTAGNSITGIDLIDSRINNALNNPGTTLVNAGVSLVPGLGLVNSISNLVGGPTVGSVLAGLADDVLGKDAKVGDTVVDDTKKKTTDTTVTDTVVDDQTKGPGNDTLVGGGGTDTLPGGGTTIVKPKTQIIGGREYVGLDTANKYGSGAERTFFRPWTREVAAADGGYFDADQYFADGGLMTPTTTPAMPTTSSFPTMAFTDGQGAVGSIAQPPGVMPSDAVGFDGPSASPMAPAPSAAAPTMGALQQALGSRNTNASPTMAPVPQNPNVGYALGQSPLSSLRKS
jgi:hypothetical protein